MRRTAIAPGRVNLIGDHTDYAGGLVLPMAIDRQTTVTVDLGAGDTLRLESEDAGDDHEWHRYVDAVVAEVAPGTVGTGTVQTTLPVGAGLSSSAALETAVALAVGFTGPPIELALACQRAEQAASGVPCGIMDQLSIAAAVEGHALRIDCSTNQVTPVPVPDDVEIVVVHSGQARTLAGSAYAERRAQLEAGDPRRVRHVETENQRVVAFSDALAAGDLTAAGRLMVESHASLRDDYEVSTEVLDDLVARLTATDGVFGARLTGAGFGGCVVALATPGALGEGWVVRPAGPARVVSER